MPVNYTYPGVYVQEIPSGVHTIAGVSTSDTAFVDFFARGPIDKAVRITGFTDFERQFGGLDKRSEASYAIYQYFLNGGSIAWVVRVAAFSAKSAARTLVSSKPGAAYGYGYSTGQYNKVLEVQAASPGEWGNNLQVAVDYKGTKRALDGQGKPIADQPLEFNLAVREVIEMNGRTVVLHSEAYRNLNLTPGDVHYAVSVVNGASSLIRLKGASIGDGKGEIPEKAEVYPPTKPGEKPVELDVISRPENAEFLWLGQDGFWTRNQFFNPARPGWSNSVEFQLATDGIAPGTTMWIETEGAQALLGMAPQGQQPINQGIRMLEGISPYIFNLLCLPGVADLSPNSRGRVLSAAAKLCEDKRAFLIVDIPKDTDALDKMVDYLRTDELPSTNYAAIYYPRIRIPDPLDDNRMRDVGPSGTVAGIYARTDAGRGVWKAPAGTVADFRGKVEIKQILNDLENGGLNTLGVNVLRNFPIYRNVVWGARTLQGSDQQASVWKYIPVRRTALYIEESLYQGLKWVVFEPNDEPLWAQIRLNVGAFMHGLFTQGAFQGTTPREAYFVKCDKETTPQNDIDKGIVNILVGFAPLKPAEFVVIKIQQMAGQIQT